MSATEAPLLVYFSSVSGNTARFIEKLGKRAVRIPLRPTDPPLHVDEPFVLVTPTYGGGAGRGVEKGAVPKQV
ncbi:class Ib ribonucleoside-diphosphate reductase assembly flavoprotein NrdI, partial [Vibrio parahaemolyticus]|nr:class Ib ribonucleoside-diphosphate reductase assembly flavoprotein NrdI [Vibrio parahaemolyticus]